MLAGLTVMPHFIVMKRALPVVAASVLLSGCFSYLPIEPGDVEPGLSVRARVSPAAGARIAPLLGATDARKLDGTVITQSADTMIVEVPTVITENREFGRSPNQRVSISRSDLVELEVRRLDKTRTMGLVGGAALIVGSALLKTLKGEPGKENLPGGGGTDNIVFRISWP